MPDSNPSRNVAFVMSAQLVVGGMLIGCVVFLLIVIAIGGSSRVADHLPVLTYGAAAIAAFLVLARAIVPRIVVAQARRRIRQGTWTSSLGNVPTVAGQSRPEEGDAEKLGQVFLMRTILSAAFLEGAAVLLLVAYLVERSPLSAILATALIIALAAHFPTAARAAEWIQEQTRLLDEERSF